MAATGDPKHGLPRRHPPQGSGVHRGGGRPWPITIVTKRPYAPMLMSSTRYETSILNEKAVKEAGAERH
ncbi:hypothetical protein MASR2M79_22140 [Aminivibrio sp.]